jgi:hypothetical protein
MGDTVDVMEALVLYAVVTSAMYVFSWFGNELSTQVREFITFSTRYNYFLMVIKIQGDSIVRGPKLLSIKNYVIEIMTSKFISTYRKRCKTGAAHYRL